MALLTYLFIVNPVAGRNNGKKAIAFINQVMGNRGLNYNIIVTEKPGDAKLLAEEAALTSVDVIVAVGGDGTVNEVFNGMINSNKILGIVPAGTGNDLARALHLPLSMDKAVEFIISENYLNVDVGKLNGQLFLNIASIGLDAVIAEEANKIKRFISSKYSYVLALLKGLIIFKSKKIKIRIDEIEIEKDVMLVAICNAICYGGGMKIAPNAKVNDGLFDICIVNKMSKLKLLYLFPTIFKGEHIKFKEVEIFRGQFVEIKSEENLSINVDGEVINHNPIEFKIINEAIKVIGKLSE